MKSRFVSLLWTAVAAVLSASAAFAAEVSSNEVAKAAETWVSQNRGGLAASFGATAESVTKEAVQGTGFYVVKMAGGGVVVLSADTTRRPVILALSGTEFSATEANPAVALLVADLKREPSEASAAANAKAWRALTRPLLKATSSSAPSDLRVAGLVTTHWSQNLDLNGDFCYDYYTPPIWKDGIEGGTQLKSYQVMAGNYTTGNSTHTPAGCAPVAVAQILNYFKYPATYPDYTRKGMWLENTNDHYEDIRLVNAGEAIPWGKMLDKPGFGGAAPEANRQAIGALCFNAGLAGAASIYGWAGTSSGDIPAAFRVFGYSNVESFGGDAATMQRIIRANLNAKRPLYIIVPGHAIVCDGYGYSGGTLYVRLNMGWSWDEHLWYSQPADDGDPVIQGGYANIYTTESAGSVILSGRVSGGAATVKAINRDDPSKTYSAESDAKGIYALVVPPGRYVAYIDVNGRYSPPRVIDMYAGVSGDVADFDFEAASATSSTEPTLQLPADYTAVEYIESDGRQTLNTGILPTETQVIAMRFSHLRDNGQFLMNLLCSGAAAWNESPRFAVEKIDGTGYYKFGALGNYGSTYNAGPYDSDTDCLSLTIDLMGGVDGSGAVWGMYQLYNETKGDWQGATYAGKGFTNLTQPYCLFSDGNGGGATSFRLYSFSVTDNGVLVGDFVPCRDAAGKACLWDKVAGRPCYDAAGNGFMAPPLEGLPEGYTALEYIESTGEQRVDTGVWPEAGQVIDMNFGEVKPCSLFNCLMNGGDAFNTWSCGLVARGDNAMWGMADGHRFSYFGQGTMFAEPGASDAYAAPGYGSVPAGCKDVFNFHLDLSANTASMSDVTTGKGSGAVAVDGGLYGVNGSIRLFGIAQANSSAAFKLYSFKVTDAQGNRMLDMVPCRNPDGVVGLFDLVRNGFCGSVSGVPFPAEPAALPADCTPVDSIESDGTQYVDTGYRPTANTRVVATVSAPAQTGAGGLWRGQGMDFAALFGSLTGGSPDLYDENWVFSDYNCCAYFLKWWSQDWQQEYMHYSTTQHSTTDNLANLPYNTKRTYDCRPDGLLIDGVQYAAFGMPPAFTSEHPLYIFGANQDGAFKYPSVMKLHSFRIYEGGVLVRDYVPCKDAQGTAGLFERMTGQFAANAAGNPFTAHAYGGTELPEGYTRIDWIESAGGQYVNTGFAPSSETRTAMDIGVAGTNENWFGAGRAYAAANAGGSISVGYGSSALRKVAGTWCSLGTSITWLNDHVGEDLGFTAGYQTRVMNVLAFDRFVNWGYSGGMIYTQAGMDVPKADYYTIEYGINDWGAGGQRQLGTIDDYTGNAANGTFFADYRIVIDKIRAANPSAKVILCTPRRGYAGGFLPETSDTPNALGITLGDYADAVKAIAAKEGFPVADFFSAWTDAEIPALSKDWYVHPNDAGYQGMADVLLKTFETVLDGVTGAPAALPEGWRGTVELNRNAFTATADGEAAPCREATLAKCAFDAGAPMYLFAHNADPLHRDEAGLRCYGCRIYAHAGDATPVRDFVPCRNASGVTGLFDLFTGEFYASASGTPFRGSDAVVVIGGIDYPSLAAGVAAAKSGDTIVLQVDSDESFTLPQGVAFDTNGKAYTGTVSSPAAGCKVVCLNGVYMIEADLPAGYTAIEYIESDGRQYIDSKVKAVSNTCVEADMQVTTIIGGRGIFGTEQGSVMNFDIYCSGTDLKYGLGSTKWASAGVSFDTARHLYILDATLNDGTLQIDDSVKVSGIEPGLADKTVTSPNNIYIGARNYDGKQADVMPCRIFGFKIREGGTAVRDFVPCRNADGVAGLYDRVTKEFYPSAAGAAFLASDDVVRIGGTGYLSLAAAFAAAKGGDTVTLFRDASEGGVLPIGVAFDTNGRAYTGTVSPSAAGYRVVLAGGVYTLAVNLPADYTAVDWIESDGRQYVDTGVRPVSTTRVEMEFAGAKDLGKSEVFFSAGAWSRNAYHFCVLNNESGASRHFMFGNSDEIEFKESGLYGIAGWNGSKIRDYRFVVGDGCLTLTDRDTKEKLHENTGLTISVSAVNSNLTLFKAPSGDAYPSAFRLYSFRISEGVEVKRDFVPCRRDSDRVAGLFDGISRQFYPSVSGANFLAPNPYGDGLPARYTALSYIESDGSQYIDTEYVHTANTRAECVISDTVPKSGNYGAVFGARNGNYQKNAMAFFSTFGSVDKTCYSRTGAETKGTAFFNGDKVRLVCEGQTAMWLKVDDPTQTGSITTTGTADNGVNSLFIFNDNTGSGTGSKSADGNSWMKMKLYSFRISEGNALMRDFTPCYDTESERHGLYDRVTATFYGDAKSGDFTGSDLAKIGGDLYGSLADAAAAAKSGDTITLLRDTDEGFALPLGVAFDPNGRQYTGTVSAPAYHKAVLVDGVYTVVFDPGEGYTEVEYIESDGNQYVDTGVTPTANTCVEMEFSGAKDLHNSEVFFSAGAWSKDAYHFCVLNQSWNGSTPSRHFMFGNSEEIEFDKDGKVGLYGIAGANGSKIRDYRFVVSDGYLKIFDRDNTEEPLWQSEKLTISVSAVKNNLTLFRAPSGDAYPSAFRLYSFKIAEGDEVKRDFVPCRRDSDHVAGLFDKITGGFYPSASGTNFLAPNPYGDELPEGIVAVDWIESDGSQYIDTGVRPDSTTRVEMEFAGAKDTGKSEVFFSAGAWSMNAYHFCVLNNGSGASRRFMFGNSTEISFEEDGLYGIAGYKDSPIRNYKFVVGGGCLTLSDRDTEETLHESTGLTISVSAVKNNLTLFRAPSGDAYPSAFRLYSFKIATGDGVPQRDFVPCRNAEGVAGLYDRVTCTFYPSAAGAQFSAPNPYGDELPPGFTQVAFIESDGSQYVDTGVKARESTRVEADMQVTTASPGGKGLFGSIGGSSLNFSIYSSGDGYVASCLGKGQDWTKTDMKFDTSRRLYVLDANDNGVLLVDGVSKTCAHNLNATGTSQYNIDICARNYDGNHNVMPCRVFGFKIYEGGTAVRDFVPCRRDSDKAPGLFDRVTCEFYPSSKKGTTFLAPWPYEGLPEEGYTQVAFIESTGTQYIDSKVKARQNTRVEADMQVTAVTGGKGLFGTEQGSVMNFDIYSSGTDLKYGLGSTKWAPAGVSFDTARHLYILDTTANDGMLQIDDSVKVSGIQPGIADKTLTSPNNIYIGARSYDGTQADVMPCRIYGFKISEGGMPAGDFVPCRRDSDKKPGLYDKVTCKFYPNNASGADFIAPWPYEGLPSGYTALDFIEGTGTQYIDSGVKAKPNTKAEMQVTVTGAGNTGFFGAVENDLWFSAYRNGSGNFASSLKNSQDWTGSSTPVMNDTKYTVTLDAGAKTYTVNGQSLTCNQSTLTGVATTTIVIGGRRRSNSVEMLPCRIYSFKLWEGETAVRDLVPCRNANGVAGLFDKAEGGFYPSSSSTTFYSGDQWSVTISGKKITRAYPAGEQDCADLLPYLKTVSVTLDGTANKKSYLLCPAGSLTAEDVAKIGVTGAPGWKLELRNGKIYLVNPRPSGFAVLVR